MKEKVVIVGAGGHAKVIVECIDKDKYDVAGYLDKDDQLIGENINGIPIIGDDSNPFKWLEKGITGCVIGIGHVGKYQLRNELYKKFKNAGFHMVNAIHPQSIISSTAIIKEGTVVLPGAVINANAHVGENVIINSRAVIEHDVVIDNGVHIAPGTVISGGSYVGMNTLIGAGTVIIQRVSIGKETIVGAGTIVIHDIPSHVLAVGNPARIVRKVK